MTNWSNRFIGLAAHVSEWSKDTTKVGCVITDSENRVQATGYNGMPTWFDDDKLILLSDDDKGRMILHSEINALNCLDSSNFSKDLNMYITKPPCKWCALSIIHSQVNIKKIYSLQSDSEGFDKRYDTETSFNLLKESGIDLIFYKVVNKNEH